MSKELEYELSIFEKEHDLITKERNKCIEILKEEMPHTRYFEILDEVKKVQGTKEIHTERMSKLISEGAKLEGNLVNLTEKLRKKQDNARDELFHLDQKLSLLNMKIARCQMRKGK